MNPQDYESDWKTKKYKSHLFNLMVDKWRLMCQPPMFHLKSDGSLEKIKPGKTIKRTWWGRIKDWLKL